MAAHQYMDMCTTTIRQAIDQFKSAWYSVVDAALHPVDAYNFGPARRKGFPLWAAGIDTNLASIRLVCLPPAGVASKVYRGFVAHVHKLKAHTLKAWRLKTLH